jgi:membrane protein YqaA with SNARE-associated domain
MLRRLYDWCIAAADKPYATWLLGIVSFVESSFFPIPPDAMLIPMALARPDRAWFYATVCTTTSVAGGVLGYLIGALLYDSVGLWLMKFYGLTGKVEAFREAYAQWGSWIILIKGVTPIPYKLVTIASGFAGYSFLMFVLLSFVARGMRFYLVAFLLNRYGVQARAILEERLGLWVSIAAVLLVGGIAAAVYLLICCTYLVSSVSPHFRHSSPPCSCLHGMSDPDLRHAAMSMILRRCHSRSAP